MEAHGLGDRFLRGFIKLVTDTHLRSTAEARVRREQRLPDGRNDIVVRGHGWWVVIENKIDDTVDATEKYARYWERWGKTGTNLFLVFLTPDGRSPKSRKFKAVSYRAVREVLRKLVPEGDSAVFIKHIADHILHEIEV